MKAGKEKVKSEVEDMEKDPCFLCRAGHIMGLPVIWSFYISKNLMFKILDKQTILLYTLKVKIKIKTRHSGDKK